MCLQFETAILLHLKSNVLFFFSMYSQQAINSSRVVLLTCTVSHSSQMLRVIQPWNWNTASLTMVMPVVVSFLTKPLSSSVPSARNLPICYPIRQSTSYGRYRPSLVIIFVFFRTHTCPKDTKQCTDCGVAWKNLQGPICGRCLVLGKSGLAQNGRYLFVTQFHCADCGE